MPCMIRNGAAVLFGKLRGRDKDSLHVNRGTVVLEQVDAILTMNLASRSLRLHPTQRNEVPPATRPGKGDLPSRMEMLISHSLIRCFCLLRIHS
jgi:hypothetical protein